MDCFGEGPDRNACNVGRADLVPFDQVCGRVHRGLSPATDRVWFEIVAHDLPARAKITPERSFGFTLDQSGGCAGEAFAREAGGRGARKRTPTGLDVAMNREIARGEVVVLPLLYEPCELPEFLKGKLYADFSKPENYEVVLAKLLRRLRIA